MKRLLGYVRPYQFWMVLGIMALAVVALAEGTIAFLIVPIIDRVLTPSASDSNLSLFKLPAGGPMIYLNQFFPHRIHNVWTVVSISLLVVFLIKGIAEFVGNSLIQYVGHSGGKPGQKKNFLQNTILHHPLFFFYSR